MASTSTAHSSPRDATDDDLSEPEMSPPLRKRQRLSSQQQASENSSPEGPVLPDSFRRSPGKARTNDATQSHQPGSIVRVSLENFVTYTSAEFFPGPNLNMVIGPNGTGKSTLVCAICLGLGWSTMHLGRAKDISEFVKHGSTRAKIEIELAKDPARQSSNQIISTRITKTGSKTEFHINGKASSKKAVQELVRSFAIQVDNLCQFLPQDRVVEFAALSPIDLLVQTQRAAAPPHLSEWHEQLKTLGRKSKEKQQSQQDILESLRQMENRQRAQQVDVDRIREHSALQQQLELLEKLRPFAQYTPRVERYREAKAKKKAVDKSMRRLQRSVEPNQTAVDEKAKYLSDVSDCLDAKSRLAKRWAEETAKLDKKYEDQDREIRAIETQHEKEKEGVKKSRQTIVKAERNILKIQDDMKNVPPIHDFSAMNEEIRQHTRTIRNLQEQKNTFEDKIRENKDKILQRQRVIVQKRTEKENMRSQLGQQASKLSNISRDTAKAWEWVQENQSKFSGQVYGPPMITCNVKEKRLTAAVESVVGRGELLSFTVTNDGDFDLLQQNLYDQQRLKLKDINIRLINRSLDSCKPPYSREQLLEYGLEGWLIDAIEGPEAVLAMLCDNSGLESVGYTSRNLTSRQYDTLKESRYISSWVTPSESTRVVRRREYGDHAVSARVQAIQDPRFFVDVPVNHEHEKRIERQINELRDECQMLKDEEQQLSSDSSNLQERIDNHASQKQKMTAEKDTLQRVQTTFEGLGTALEGQQDNLVNERKKILDLQASLAKFDEKLDSAHLTKGQIAIDYVKRVEQSRIQQMEVLKVELMLIEAQSDHHHLSQRFAREAEMLKRFREECQELERACIELKREAEDVSAACRKLEEEISDEHADLMEQVQKMTEEELDVELESTKARLELNAGGNANIISEYEARATKIRQKQSQLEQITSAVEELATTIKELQDRWEPELEDIISKISASFAENFASIQCAGEVGIYKDDDFEKWAVQIKVKFREQEPLSILDSHRQSGGERAVSTIFYLMALQSLARAPFRVVDEINQGMDPRNERLVHSRLVQIACQARRDDGSGGSQYFLITPKLLNGLEYHPSMKVHCIASGEWMPDDNASLDFRQLARRALAVQSTRS